MQRIFHTPEGVRDIYNGECSQKHHLQAEIYKVFRSYLLNTSKYSMLGVSISSYP